MGYNCRPFIVNKKYFALCLALLLNASFIYSSVKIGDLYYSLDIYTNTAYVTTASYNSNTDEHNEGWNISQAHIPSNVIYDNVSYKVVGISDYAFENCKNLNSITIANSITYIGWMAFRNCSSLTSISIPNSVTEVGSCCFSNCTKLETVTLPDSLENIYDYTFYDCASLKNINIPNTIRDIQRCAFRGCSSLPSINIPNTVTRIGEAAFQKCSNLQSVVLPDSLISIDRLAFEVCINLSYIEIPNSVTTIGENAFAGCKSLKTIIIPSSVTEIGKYTFYDCTSLKSVVWGIKSLKDDIWVYDYNTSIFNKCDSVTQFEFGGEVEDIPKYLCRNMKNLYKLIIPKSVTTIGTGSFTGCANLITIVNNANIPQSIDNNVFQSVDKTTCKLIVPKESVELYKQAPVWKEFYKIQAIGEEEAIDQITNNLSQTTNKIIQDGQIIILSGDKAYTVTGQEVK